MNKIVLITYSATMGSTSSLVGVGVRFTSTTAAAGDSTPSTVNRAPNAWRLLCVVGCCREGPANMAGEGGGKEGGGSRSWWWWWWSLRPCPCRPPTSSNVKSATTRRASFLSRDDISPPCSSIICALRSIMLPNTTNLRAKHWGWVHGWCESLKCRSFYES